MKTKIFFISILVIALIFNISAQIKVLSTGQTAICTTSVPSGYQSFISGGKNEVGLIDNLGHSNITFESWGIDMRISSNTGIINFYTGSTQTYNDIQCRTLTQHSDIRSKTNISTVTNGLTTIKKLRGVSFNWKSDIGKKNVRMNFGFIAQEVEPVIKDAVYTDDSVGDKTLAYSAIEPFLVEAVKELSGRIDSLEKILAKGSGTIKSAKIIDSTGIMNFAKAASLSQNAPNPFNQNTTIAYYLPETTKNAAIYIYNMQGNQIKVIPVNTYGNGSIVIYGSELKPGMYLYSLIADGKEIDTKRMILTE